MFLKSKVGRINTKKLNTYQEGYLLPVVPGRQFLEGQTQKRLIHQVAQLVNIGDQHFEALYLQLLERFADYVQVIPGQPKGALCGLFNEGLARANVIMKHTLLGSQFPQDTLYHYALFSAALLNDVSKLMINQRVFITDPQGRYIEDWHPLAGNLAQVGAAHYKLYELAPIYQRIAEGVTPMLAQKIMPPLGLNWLLSDMTVFAEWLDALRGNFKDAGQLGRALELMRREDLYNTLSDLMQLPIDLIDSLENPLGEAYLQWLKEGLESGEISINSSEAGVHVTDEGVFIERNKTFRDFADKFGKDVSSAEVYQQFANLMGLAEDGAQMGTAQYVTNYPEVARRGEGLSTPYGNRSFRQGMVVGDQAMLFLVQKMPAASAMIKQAQSGSEGKSTRTLPVINQQQEATLKASRSN